MIALRTSGLVRDCDGTRRKGILGLLKQILVSVRVLVVAAAGRSGTVEQFIVLATPQPAPALWDLQGVTLPDWMTEPPATFVGESPRITAHAVSVRVRGH